jgi:hypothetical protein
VEGRFTRAATESCNNGYCHEMNLKVPSAFGKVRI